MLDNIKLAFVWIIIVAVVVLIAWGGYTLQRSFHWNWSYESRVEKAIEERVAPLETRIKDLEDAQEKE